MKILQITSLILILVLAQSCEEQKKETSTYTACNERNRPDECTEEYQPVCGFGQVSPKTFSNGCTACSTTNIYGYQNDGECTQEQINQSSSIEQTIGKCDDRTDGENLDCNSIQNDTGFCGHYATPDSEGDIKKLFESPCQACTDSKVVFWVKGTCSPQDSNQSSLIQIILFINIAIISLIL